MAPLDNGNSNGHAAQLVDEETPLLPDQAVERSNSSNDNAAETPQELSRKKLVLILASIYVGVFLGALGKYQLVHVSHLVISRLILLSRLDNYSDARNAHIFILP